MALVGGQGRLGREGSTEGWVKGHRSQDLPTGPGPRRWQSQ